MEPVKGRVARLVSDDELIINKGSEQGVEVGMIFEVLDERTLDVRDPETGEDLGSIFRSKARVVVRRVSEKMAIAERYGSASILSTSSLGTILGGRTPRSILSGDRWPEGVSVGDQIFSSGLRVPPPKPPELAS